MDEDDSKVQRSLSEVQQNLDTVILEGKRLTSLIDDLLDIAKIEAGKVEWNMESISVAEIIKRATAVTSSNFNKTS